MTRIKWTVWFNMVGTLLSVYGAFTEFQGTLHLVGFSMVTFTAGMLIEQAIQLKNKFEQKPAG